MMSFMFFYELNTHRSYATFAAACMTKSTPDGLWVIQIQYNNLVKIRKIFWASLGNIRWRKSGSIIVLL